MKNLFLAFLILFTVIGCSRTGKQEHDYQIESAQVAINEQRFSDAIDILKNMDQTDTQIIDLTSTSYAGRAGFNSLAIADIIENTKGDPIQALYQIGKKFGSSNINDSEIAIKFISNISDNPDNRPSPLNVKFSAIQLYKISQIVLKNINHFGTEDGIQHVLNWDPCVEANLTAEDLREIIISVNRAIISVKNVQSNVYDSLVKIQNQLKIDPSLFEAEIVKATDLTNLRIQLGDNYSEYVGTNTSYSCDTHPAQSTSN